MADIATQSPTLAGLAPAFTACSAGGDAVPNNGRTELEFRNTGGSPLTVTITPQRKAPGTGATVSPVAVSVPATTGERRIGFFNPEIFNDANGKLAITYSGVTGLTVAAIQFP